MWVHEYATNSINKIRGDNMLKQILDMFYAESNSCLTKQELSGYFYGTYDMLFIMVSNNIISQSAYVYLIKKIEKTKGILLYQKFKNVNYLNWLEKTGRL